MDPVREDMQLTNILALHETICDRPANTLPRLFFVSVVSGTIKKTVACLDGIINGLE